MAKRIKPFQRKKTARRVIQRGRWKMAALKMGGSGMKDSEANKFIRSYRRALIT